MIQSRETLLKSIMNNRRIDYTISESRKKCSEKSDYRKLL